MWARAAGSWVWVLVWARVGKGDGRGWRMVGQREEVGVAKEGREGREWWRVWQELQTQVGEQRETACRWVLGLLGSVLGGGQAAFVQHAEVPVSWLMLPDVGMSGEELGCAWEAC